jgi:hypothetical protein
MKKALFFFIPLILVLGACASQPEKIQPKKTQLEIRAMQTRSYDTKDVKMVMKAVMHSLQDDNFIIQQANVDLGLLTAQKEVDLENLENLEKSEDISSGAGLAIVGVIIAIIVAAALLSKGSKENSLADKDKSGFGGHEPSFDRDEPSFDKSAITEVSANISEFGEQTQVRINFRVKVLDNKGATAEVKQIDDPKYYQYFFSKVDKSVFLGKENLQ